MAISIAVSERQRPSVLVPSNRRHDDVRHHVEKQRIVVDRRGARHRQADLPAHVGGFAVEVVQHLDVIADEADRAEHRRARARSARACRR